jgi:tRNA (guanine-N7-)-methyltransferase
LSIVRVREHVNPLSQKYQVPVQPPDWQKMFAQPDQPLHLDIGCGRGRFLLSMAQSEPAWNFLGLEIREPLVEQANNWKDELGLQNLYYLFCNVNNAIAPILHTAPPLALHRVTIQFPDPWFKRKHQKRRMIQPAVVATLANHLVDGGIVFIQSDVKEVAQEICDRFAAHAAFQKQGNEEWLSTNPLPIPTERESSTLLRGEPVYRTLFVKIANGLGNR